MRRSPLVVAAAASLALLAGCAPTVAMSPAAGDANDPACADVIARIYHGGTPLDIADYGLRTTDAQGTAAWGEPTVALLYCGVPVPEPSELPCIEYGGIFWLREEVDAGFAFTTYGRDPAIRLIVDDEIVGGPGVALDELTDVVSYLPENGRECLSTDDTVTGQSLDDDAEG
jgi:Protein of unknown function (DUF3515).